MEYEVKHNEKANRFEAVIGEKVIGLIDYMISSDKKLIIVPHTEVNSEFEGRGIAGEMTKVLLGYVRENNMSISPICPYTAAYITRHPEYQDLLDKDK
ncbi:MAG: GNAT family N-acetyltransferase [Dysgonomonas sp.]|nr:GNAT family N-acetyltransferase [Dysgonomonas sp.]